MNLIIIALVLLGISVVAYAIIYALICCDDVTLPVRILSLIILIGGYAGVIALTMLLTGTLCIYLAPAKTKMTHGWAVETLCASLFATSESLT